MPRKETAGTLRLQNGVTMTVRVLDGILPEDLIIQGAKAEGYRVITGKDLAPTPGRSIKDFLLRIGMISR